MFATSTAWQYFLSSPSGFSQPRLSISHAKRGLPCMNSSISADCHSVPQRWFATAPRQHPALPDRPSRGAAPPKPPALAGIRRGCPEEKQRSELLVVQNCPGGLSLAQFQTLRL